MFHALLKEQSALTEGARLSGQLSPGAAGSVHTRHRVPGKLGNLSSIHVFLFPVPKKRELMFYSYLTSDLNVQTGQFKERAGFLVSRSLTLPSTEKLKFRNEVRLFRYETQRSEY